MTISDEDCIMFLYRFVRKCFRSLETDLKIGEMIRKQDSWLGWRLVYSLNTAGDSIPQLKYHFRSCINIVFAAPPVTITHWYTVKCAVFFCEMFATRVITVNPDTNPIFQIISDTSVWATKNVWEGWDAREHAQLWF